MRRIRVTFFERSGFTLVEVMLALAVFAFAVVGLVTALNTAIQAALDVRERAAIRQELESRIAYRMAIPMDKEQLVTKAKDNHGVQLEEILTPHPLTNKNGTEIQSIKELKITATLHQQSDSATILVRN